MEVIKENDYLKVVESIEVKKTKDTQELIQYLKTEKEKKEHELRMIQEYLRYFEK